MKRHSRSVPVFPATSFDLTASGGRIELYAQAQFVPPQDLPTYPAALDWGIHAVPYGGAHHSLAATSVLEDQPSAHPMHT